MRSCTPVQGDGALHAGPFNNVAHTGTDIAARAQPSGIASISSGLESLHGYIIRPYIVSAVSEFNVVLYGSFKPINEIRKLLPTHSNIFEETP
jgi:hypothetical protein